MTPPTTPEPSWLIPPPSIKLEYPTRSSWWISTWERRPTPAPATVWGETINNFIACVEENLSTTVSRVDLELSFQLIKYLQFQMGCQMAPEKASFTLFFRLVYLLWRNYTEVQTGDTDSARRSVRELRERSAGNSS